MTLKLYYHPLSSFCHKVLMALYENATPFEPVMVDFCNEEAAAQFKALWPIGKIPVLRDEARDRTVPETSIIIEYLAQHYPGRVNLVFRTMPTWRGRSACATGSTISMSTCRCRRS